MTYTELLSNGAPGAEIQSYLADSGNAPVTFRMPRTLRDAAKEAATLNGVNFTSLVKMRMIEKLVEMRQN